MPARKRARQEVEPEDPPPPQEPTKLQKLRNTWEFASLVQYIYIFGSVVKIDEDIDVDELEAECLRPTASEKLAQIGLALLKYVSSHKGLTLEIFDEYARRQYVAKAPQRNPFGVEEEPNKFNDMDTFTKIRILQQLSTWTLNNPDRIREKMPEQRDVEQTNWRVDPIGWDKDDHTYFVLDDDRLYRRTDPPLPADPTPKSKSRSKPKPKKTKGTRASKRRRISTTPPESDAEQEEETIQDQPVQGEDTFGGMKWECVAVTLEEYQAFVNSIRRSRNPNEKELVKRLEADVIPIIEKRAEQQRQKALKKQRELENMEKLANAKRSSRIAGRLEKQKEQEAAVEAERRRVADLEMAKKEQEKQKQMEEARQSRMMTREQRLKEREVKRILHEEELKRLEENSKKAESNEARMSERHLKAEMERRQKELEQMAQEEENWIFDCAMCGVHGENLDDGSHSIACEKCNVWQHSACHGIAKAQAERDDFHFVCSDCKRRAEEASRHKLPPLKFKVGASASPKPDSSTSSSAAVPSTDYKTNAVPTSTQPPRQAWSPQPTQPMQAHRPVSNGILNGPSLSPHGQTSGPPGILRPGSGYGSAHSTPSHPTQAPMPQLHAGNAPSIPPPRFTAGGQSGKNVMAGSPNWQHSPYSQGQPYQGQTNGHPHSSVLSSPNRPLTHNPRSPSSGFGTQSPSKPSAPVDQRRPMSAGYGAASPSKPAPASSPYQANGYPMTAPFSSPGTSFPPAPVQRPAFSPVKQSSSPPQQHSSPFVDGSSRLLPEPSAGISPEKHDNALPSSQGLSEAPVLPPVAPLAPSANPPILTPPSKKTPESSQTEATESSAQPTTQPLAPVAQAGGGAPSGPPSGQ